MARDRFLVHCFNARVPFRRGLRVLETSPRMDERYRAAMSRWFDYLASDYDERGHRATLHIDLQDIALEDNSLDVILTPHVLEHVPDTDRALEELYRVLADGGSMFLQVPILQPVTAPPDTPEFHDDDTPVFWRFGFDLTQRLRTTGFETELLCPDELLELVRAGAERWPTDPASEFDVEGMLRRLTPEDLVPIADREQARRSGFDPAYMFLTWACRKPLATDA